MTVINKRVRLLIRGQWLAVPRAFETRIRLAARDLDACTWSEVGMYQRCLSPSLIAVENQLIQFTQD